MLEQKAQTLVDRRVSFLCRMVENKGFLRVFWLQNTKKKTIFDEIEKIAFDASGFNVKYEEEII